MANSEFIEIISEQTKAQIDAIMPLVRELAKSIKDINSFSVAGTPSGADKNINAINDAYKKRGKSIEQVRRELEKLSYAEKDAESKRKASINAQWDAYEKAKKKEKEISDRNTANEIANAEKEAKAEIEKNNKIIQSAEKRAQKEKEIEDKKNASILASKQRQADAQAKIDARNSRTGASSVIPGMAGKIADLKQAEREALSVKKLNDAYGQLTTKRNEAARALQNSIVATGKYSSETKKLQKEFDVLNKKVAEADKAIGKFSQANNGFQQLAGGIRNFVSAFGVTMGIGLAIDIGKNIYETTKQLQSLDLALKMVSGSQIEFKNNQIFLRGLAEQYGIEIKGLTKNFTEFWVASKGKLEAEQIKEIFTSISKSVAVMGLSVEQQDSAFLALQQMMSKGTVQAEELKKQLGNALPGAIKAATMAYQALHPEMKVTEKFFMEQMKAGKVLSAELLPELAKQYEKLYGIENVKRAETLQAAQERLANSWTDMVRSMNESETSGIAVFFKAIAGGLTNTLRLLTRYNTEWNKLNEKSEEKGRLFGFEITETKGKTTAQLLEGRNKLFEASKKTADEITKLKAKFAKEGFFSEINPFSDTGADIEKLYADLGQYKGAIEKINQILHPSSKPKALPVEETEDERKKREEKERKAREKREKEFLKSRQVESVLSGKLELSKAEDTALERLKLLKEALEKTRDETAKNAKEFKEFEESIEGVNKAIEVITKPLKTDISKELDEWQKNYKNQKKEEEQIAKDALEAQRKTFNEFMGTFADKLGLGESFELFGELDEDGKTYFGKLLEAEDKTKAYFLAVTTAAQDAFNLMEEMENEKFDRRLARLEKEKEVALRFAGDSESAKLKIEEDFEKRRKDLELKQFKSKQRNAIVNIAIDTAQAAMASWAKTGFPWAAAAAIAMGAIQTALVMSQKPPEYWTGTDDAEAGLAWTQERGAEIITDKKGNIKDFGDNKGARLTMMEKGDKVYTASETKQMMFNKELNSLMLDNGISMPKVVVNNSGISKSDMRDVMIETLGNQPQYHSGFDGSGFYRYMSRNGSITKRSEDRGNANGLIF